MVKRQENFSVLDSDTIYTGQYLNYSRRPFVNYSNPFSEKALWKPFEFHNVDACIASFKCMVLLSVHCITLRFDPFINQQ